MQIFENVRFRESAVLAEFGIYFFTAKKVRPKWATRCDESAQFDTRLVCVKPDRTVMGVGSLLAELSTPSWEGF